MKTITLILALPILLFSFSNCGGTQSINNMKNFVETPPFKVAEAYYQKWVAGVEEGGSGTNVHITFNEIDKDVVIQNIYFKNHKLEAKSNINEPNKYVGYLKNEMKTDVIMDSDTMKEAQNTLSKTIPFQLEENQAVLEYWFGGKKNYYKIENLSKKEMIPYPKANPNSHE
jgi:hypothetical protein